jgi:hypothetical protein
MFIQVKAENPTFGNQDWQAEVEALVKGTLGRWEERITSLEVLISNEQDREKAGGGDKRCRIEARLPGLEPVAVGTHAPFYDVAIADCAEEMARTLTRRLSRSTDDGPARQSELN